jgi:hypothetical protein
MPVLCVCRPGGPALLTRIVKAFAPVVLHGIIRTLEPTMP